MDFVTALNVTIYGLGIVFLALLVVMFAIMVLSRLFSAATGKDFLVAPAASEDDLSEISPQSEKTTGENVAVPSVSSPALVVKPVPSTATSPVPLPSAPAVTKPVVVDQQITAPLPGKILSITVMAGDFVLKGQELCVIEAMKMANSIKAQWDCTVKEVKVSTGDTVPFGALLFMIE